MVNYDGDINLRVDLTPGDVTSTARELQSRIKEISKLDFGKNLSKSFGNVLDKIKDLSPQLDELLGKMRELETVRPTSVYTNLEKELDSLLAKQRELTDQIRRTDFQRNMAQGSGDTGRFVTLSTELINYNKELDTVNTKIADVTSSMKAMEAAGTNVFSETGTSAHRAYKEELEGVNDELTKYVNIAEQVSNNPAFTPDTATSKWQSYMAVLSQTHPILARIGSVAGEAFQRVVENVQFTASHIKQSLLNVLHAIPELAGKAAMGLAKLAGTGIINGLKLIGKAALFAAKNLGKMAANAVKAVSGGIINGFKRLASAITKTNKASSNANGTFKKGFLFLLRYALGIRSIYFLFRRLRKALGEGFGNLARYSGGFNSVVSDFISALTRLKNTFATAFAPIVNVVLPIITTFINAMSEAVTRVGMLIAALTGQTTFIRAKAVQQDYAASLDSAASSADKAKKSAEEYQRTISGFDDVEILKEPDDDSSGGSGSPGGGGGGGGVSPADMFETVGLPAGYYDLAQMIKDSWANADFTDLGALLGQKIAEALYNIPWDTIQKFAGNFGKSFATFINGLLSVEELARAIGYTIGQAINTLFVLANGFVSNLNWEQIGKFFADVMNEGIKTIKWELIADTLAKTANGVFNAVGTWAKKFNFSLLGTEIKDTVVQTLNGLHWDEIKEAVSNLGTGLGKFVNSLITPGSFGTIGTAIAEALNTAIGGIKSFAITTDWKNLGSSVASAINNFFDTFDFKEAGLTLSTLAVGLLDAAINAVEKVDWHKVGTSIAEFIAAIDWGEILKKSVELISGLAGALLGFIDGLFEPIGTAIEDFFKKPENQQGENIIEGLFSGIDDWFKGIGTWVYDHIFKPFADGISKAFGIASPAKEMKPFGENIILGLFQGILDWMKGIDEWIKTNVFDKITGAFNKVGETISVGVGLVRDGWTKITDWVVSFGKAAIDMVVSRVKDWTTSFTDWASAKADMIVSRVKDWRDSFNTWASATADMVVSRVKNWRDSFNKWANATADLIVSRVKNWKDSFNKWASATADLTVSRVKNWKESFNKWADATANMLVSRVKNWKDSFTKWIGGANLYVNRIKKWKTSMRQWITGNRKGIISVGISLFKSGWESLKKFFGLHKGGIVGANGSIKAFAKGGIIKSYGTGGAPTHGTVFVAGEAGTEAVGHINGRTEVMNQFQMAGVMSTAIISAVTPVIRYMQTCTNAIITNIGFELNYLKFMSGQLYDINLLSNSLSTNVGNIVTGKVVPNNFNSTDINNLNQTLDKLSSMLYDTRSNAVTRDELVSVLTTMFTRYMNFSCYIGDEDIARHANNGNARLEMRFNPIAR